MMSLRAKAVVVAVAVLVVSGVSLGPYLQANLGSSDQVEELTPCSFVEKFKIVNRAAKVTLADIEFIRNLFEDLDRYDWEAIRELEDYINEHGSITEITQLLRLEKFDGGTPGKAGARRAFLVRIFYALAGDEECMVPSVEAGDPAQG